MTSPANTIEGPGGRFYTHPDHPEQTFRSVTNGLSNGVPKRLDNWFKRLTAEYAVDHHNLWGPLERPAAVDLIARECDRQRDAAADRGSIAHAVLEIAARLDLATFDDFATYRAAALAHAGIWIAGAEAYIDAGLRFLWEWRPTIRHAEATVYSFRYRYAGTADLFAEVPLLGPAVLDFKTSKDVYAETGLQLAAYRFADVVRVGDVDHPVPDVAWGAAVHLRPDGTYAVVPLACGPELHRVFLHALEVADFATEGWKDVRRPPLQSPPAERPWWAAPERREWVKARIVALGDHSAAGLATLAANWPTGVPTLRESPHHTDDQLAAIVAALSFAEAQVEAPFFPGDPTAGPTHGDRPLVPSDACTVIAARIDALPADLRVGVEAAAHKAGMPTLTSGRFSVEDLSALEQALTPAELEAGQRWAAYRAALGDMADDTEICGVLLARATDGRHSDPRRLTDAELERAHLLAEAVLSTTVQVAWAEDGAVSLVVPPATEVRLLAAFGMSKAALLAAGRESCRALGLPQPKGGSAGVVADPLIVAHVARAVAA